MLCVMTENERMFLTHTHFSSNDFGPSSSIVSFWCSVCVSLFFFHFCLNENSITHTHTCIQWMTHDNGEKCRWTKNYIFRAKKMKGTPKNGKNESIIFISMCLCCFLQPEFLLEKLLMCLRIVMRPFNVVVVVVGILYRPFDRSFLWPERTNILLIISVLICSICHRTWTQHFSVYCSIQFSRSTVASFSIDFIGLLCAKK